VKIGRILIFSVLTLVALAAAGLAYVRSIDFDRYGPALEAELRAATGRDVVIDGAVGLSLWPRPRFFASRVAVANAPWGTRDALAEVDRVEADLAILPLFKGERRLSHVRLIRPDLWFETDSVGKVNWILAGDGVPGRGLGHGAGGGSDQGRDRPADGFLSFLDIDRVEMDGGRITYRDGATGDITVLTVHTAAVEGDGYATPLEIAFDGGWDALPVELRGVVGPFEAIALEGGTASAVRLQLETGDAQLAIDGTVGDPHRGPGASLRVSAKAEDLDLLGRRLGIALPLTKKASFNADLRFRKARLDLTGIHLDVGGQEVIGKMSVDFSAPRPVFDGALQTSSVDAASLVRAAGSSAGGPALGPIEALAAGGALASADGTLTLHANSLNVYGARLSGMNARIVLKDGSLAVEPVTAHSIVGKLDGGIRIDTSVSPIAVVAHLKSPAFSPGPLLQRTGTVKAFGGVASLALRFTTNLGAPDAMLAALDGDVLLAMGEGRLTLEPVDRPFAENAPGFGLLAGLTMAEGRRDVAIECVAGRLTIQGATARGDGFVLKTSDARVKGEGSIDLAQGTLALRFTPDARDGALLVGQPVQVGGTLSAPLVRLDPSGNRKPTISDATLYPFRRFFAGLMSDPSANACLRALPPVPPKRGARSARGRPVAQRPERTTPPRVVSPALTQGPSYSEGTQAE
jgi:uncharacterized protein involved in outer membrane biogenesis